LEKTDRMTQANIRLHWADSEQGQYGETRAFVSDGMRGAEVYVRPDLRAMGPDIFASASQDALLRETIVYLTCLHETGHALGLSHTADFADIMYFFGYDKGDVREYFGRYRRKLRDRADIVKNSGISPQDRTRFIQALK
jgi:predicted Zn-dependent protease